MDQKMHQLLDAAIAIVTGITPAALGASVSMAYERGLTWGDRFARLAVGVIVSWFATGAVAQVWPFGHIDGFALQGISFTAGMIAYKATPPLAHNITDIIVSLPGSLRDRWLGPKKGGDA